MFVDFTMPGMLQKPILAGVYKMTFDGAKFYIGGAQNLNIRFHKWKHMLTVGEFKNFQVKEAYQGCSSVKMEVVEIVTDLGLLDARETFHIQSHWGNLNLLNRSPMASTNQGLKWTDQQIEILRNRTGQPVGKYDKDGNLMATYGTVREAIDENKLGRTEILRVFKWHGRSSRGFIYKRLDADGRPIEPPIKPKKQRSPRNPLSVEARQRMSIAQQKKVKDGNFTLPIHSKPIIKYDENRTEIERFRSMRHAAQSVGADEKNFKRAITSGRLGYYKGYFYFPA